MGEGAILIEYQSESISEHGGDNQHHLQTDLFT